MRAPLALAAVAALGLSCLVSKPNGARPATEADRAATAMARYVCLAPAMFQVVDGKVVDPAEKRVDPKNDVVLYEGFSGAVLVEGQQATTNHWVDGGQDHFFSWFTSSRIGLETVMSSDRSAATQLFWAPVPGDEEAYQMRQMPDGTTRPSGIPTDVFSCDVRQVFEGRRRAGRSYAKGAEPLPESAVGPALRMRVRECARGDRKMERAGKDNTHPDWGWMPYEIWLPAADADVALLSYERLSVRGQPLWRAVLVPAEDGPTLKAAFGYVQLVVTVRRSRETTSALATGQIASVDGAVVSCEYAP